MNDDLVKKIEGVLTQFGREELGNRLSQFAMIALQNMILNEIKNYKGNGGNADELSKRSGNSQSGSKSN
jgi:hypothetical protein